MLKFIFVFVGVISILLVRFALLYGHSCIDKLRPIVKMMNPYDDLSENHRKFISFVILSGLAVNSLFAALGWLLASVWNSLWEGRLMLGYTDVLGIVMLFIVSVILLKKVVAYYQDYVASEE